MSRSYKHIPIVKSTGKNEKKIANKQVRKIEDLGNGGQYKRSYKGGWIHDYTSYISKGSDYYEIIIRK